MPKPCEDFFETGFFEVYENGKKTMDLMPVFHTELAYADGENSDDTSDAAVVQDGPDRH